MLGQNDVARPDAPQEEVDMQITGRKSHVSVKVVVLASGTHALASRGKKEQERRQRSHSIDVSTGRDI